MTVKTAENKWALKIDKFSGFAEQFYRSNGLAVIFTRISPSPGKRDILKGPLALQHPEKSVIPHHFIFTSS